MNKILTYNVIAFLQYLKTIVSKMIRMPTPPSSNRNSSISSCRSSVNSAHICDIYPSNSKENPPLKLASRGSWEDYLPKPSAILYPPGKPELEDIENSLEKSVEFDVVCPEGELYVTSCADCLDHPKKRDDEEKYVFECPAGETVEISCSECHSSGKIEPSAISYPEKPELEEIENIDSSQSHSSEKIEPESSKKDDPYIFECPEGENIDLTTCSNCVMFVNKDVKEDLDDNEDKLRVDDKMIEEIGAAFEEVICEGRKSQDLIDKIESEEMINKRECDLLQKNCEAISIDDIKSEENRKSLKEIVDFIDASLTKGNDSNKKYHSSLVKNKRYSLVNSKNCSPITIFVSKKLD